MGTAAEVDAADRIDREWGDVFDISLHQPLESVAHAHDVHSFEGGSNRRSTDDCIDAGGRAAPHQDGQFLMMFHASIIGWQASKLYPFTLGL